jgi:hypothetical protein
VFPQDVVFENGFEEVRFSIVALAAIPERLRGALRNVVSASFCPWITALDSGAAPVSRQVHRPVSPDANLAVVRFQHRHTASLSARVSPFCDTNRLILIHFFSETSLFLRRAYS